MLIDLLTLCISFAIILGACELFTNGIEWFGARLEVGEPAVGSILAAIGTALPETVVPILAIVFFPHKQGSDVGLGAIAGSPFMLSTLTLSLCGLTVLYCSRAGRRPPELSLDRTAISRDLRFFMASYSTALITALLSPPAAARWLVAAGLLATYALYLRRTLKHAAGLGAAPEKLHFGALAGAPCQRLSLILLQVAVGVCGIVGGAFLFVDHLQSLAIRAGVPALALSFVVSPIATEAPEKINSILWARAGKDTLAFANITGALVFQSCFPVAFGVALTSWHLSPATVGTGFVSLACAAAWLALLVAGRLRPAHLLAGAAVYLVTVTVLLLSATRC